MIMAPHMINPNAPLTERTERTCVEIVSREKASTAYLATARWYTEALAIGVEAFV